MKAAVCLGLLSLLAIAGTLPAAGAAPRPWSDEILYEGDLPAAAGRGDVAAVWPKGSPEDAADSAEEDDSSTWQELWGWDHWLAQGELSGQAVPLSLLPLHGRSLTAAEVCS